MSSLNNSDVAELVRRRFNGPEGDELRYLPLVDPALRQLAYDVARDPDLRNYLQTDPSTATAVLNGSGVADLSALVTSPRILIECLAYGDILPPTGAASTQPMRLVDHEGQGQIAGAYDSLVYKCWLEGTSLHTRSADNNVNPLTGSLRFAVAYWPTIAQLPEALVEKLVWGPYWVVPDTQSKNEA